MARHVIILGAGASGGSGYPLANGLRVFMSSKLHLMKLIGDVAQSDPVGWGPQADKMFNHLQRPITLFRNGGFASVDEFCKLGSGFGLRDDVNLMRSWTRSVLTIWNPENQFEKSEYYNFVQSLFQGNLHELRSDTAVLSFNYDVYLEFLLSRALKVRQDMIAGKRTNDLLNSVTGGFFNPDQRDWFEQEGRFCVLKLHGSVVYPEAPGSPFSYELLFSTENTFQRRRLQMALEPTNVNDYPPIIFPWEAIRENGTFCGKDEFPHTERRHEFELFQRIWDRAEREVASAEKVSFVGISMHPFMEFGLKFLFRNCEPSKKIEIVVANPFNREIKVRAPNNVADSFISKPDPRCPGGKIDNFLSKRQAATHFDYNLRMVDSFNTFIAEEMG